MPTITLTRAKITARPAGTMAKPSSKPSHQASQVQSPSHGSSDSYDSYETYESESTAPTSLYASSRVSFKGDNAATPTFQPVYEEDISPSTSCCPRASSDTFDSTLASDLGLCKEAELEHCNDDQEIPQLPPYRRSTIVDPNVRPSTPQNFANLFPSMDRLSIRHDDFTSDGNLNLRVDTAVPGHRPVTMQLFHLRMYDLARREFSLRRYCRDSGREVCHSQRKYTDPTSDHRPTLQRSVSNALKSFGGPRPLIRTNSGGSIFSSKKKNEPKCPQSGHSSNSSDISIDGNQERTSFGLMQQKPRPAATNSIKLEFSNYARVEVSRRGKHHSARYEFRWWGHRYHWKRVHDSNVDAVSFHLMRDGHSVPVAHIVPETRSPVQIEEDEDAGGWIPPCFLWISDQSIVDAMTDVADVVVATGLVALVDDCITCRWQTKKVHRISLPLTSRSVDFEYVGPKALVQSLFQRRASEPAGYWPWRTNRFSLY